MQLDHPILGIDREYLLDDTVNGITYRDAYLNLIRQVWAAVYPQDVTEVGTIAMDILNFEIALANVNMQIFAIVDAR